LLRDYRAWHEQYGDPNSPLSGRLRIVQRRLGELITAAPAGPIRLISMCAGQGHDLLGVVPTHERRSDVSGVLVEIDPLNASVARETSAAAGLTSIEVLEADAAISDVYALFVPADIVLAVGILGNVTDGDIENTVRTLSMLCSPGAAVMWTHHREPPDKTHDIRAWFVDAGYEELTFDAPESEKLYGIGTARLVTPPAPWRSGHRFFTFIR